MVIDGVAADFRRAHDVRGIMKRIVMLLLIAGLQWLCATTRRLRLNCKTIPRTQQANIIVQYAPGTQLNCSGLLGLVDCLLNDILQVRRYYSGRPATGQWCSCAARWQRHCEPFKPVERFIHQSGPCAHSALSNAAPGDERVLRRGSLVTPGLALEWLWSTAA